MGELHLEIIYKRLTTEFRVDADLGQIQVAYKESLLPDSSPSIKKSTFERKLGDVKHCVVIELELRPTFGHQAATKNKIKLYTGRDKDKAENLTHLTDKQLKHIQNGVDSAMRFGPKLGFPVIILHD